MTYSFHVPLFRVPKWAPSQSLWNTASKTRCLRSGNIYCSMLKQLSAVFPFARAAHKGTLEKPVPESCVSMADSLTRVCSNLRETAGHQGRKKSVRGNCCTGERNTALYRKNVRKRKIAHKNNYEKNVT